MTPSDVFRVALSLVSLYFFARIASYLRQLLEEARFDRRIKTQEIAVLNKTAIELAKQTALALARGGTHVDDDTPA